jgi:hypothetical protein
MMKGIAYFAPNRMERRGMEINAEPNPVKVLMIIAAEMIRKVKIAIIVSMTSSYSLIAPNIIMTNGAASVCRSLLSQRQIPL